MVILDVPIPGIGPGKNITGLWWAQFHMVRDIPEMLVDGHEREYLTWFYRHTCNPAAITQEDIDEYVSHYSAPGGMRVGFEYYRALLDDVKQNIESSKIKLPMPVLLWVENVVLVLRHSNHCVCLLLMYMVALFLILVIGLQKNSHNF